MISTNFVPDLEKELEFRKKEKEQLSDQLALYDVRIDRYDAIIENMDKSILPLINEINVAISSVKTAYDARITAGCKSDLVWSVTSTRTVKFGSIESVINTYTVTKNPAVRITYGRWGAKYYRRPQNQDYGSNIVGEFFGSIGVGNTNLAVTSSGIAGTSFIKIGDTITDDLETPVTFGIDDLPSVVSFGTSTLVIDQVDFGGEVSLGKTIIGHVGVGTTIGISTGNIISNSAVLPYNTTVVGFGTTTTTFEVWNATTGSFISSTGVVNSLIVSSASLATTSTTFKVGITSVYPSVFLSTTSDFAANNNNFTVIRTTQSNLEEFDYTNNPIDPVTVGIMGTTTAGLGHTLVRVNNGSPTGPFQWREVLGEFDPQPACGNGADIYYSGNFQWPTFNRVQFNFGGIGIASTNYYAPEGTSVEVFGLGGIYPIRTSIGYTGTSSINPSSGTCTPLDSAISAAESSRDVIIARNQPIIDSTIEAASTIRYLRDKLEGIAFTILQGRTAADAEIVKLTRLIATMRSFNYLPYEPTTFRSVNRFSSSTVGIATT